MDMATENDRKIVRRVVTNSPRRWAGVTPAIKAQVVEQLRLAMLEAESIDDLPERVKARTSIAKTLVLIEGQNQKDEHLDRELDTPKRHEHEHTVFHVPPPRVIERKGE